MDFIEPFFKRKRFMIWYIELRCKESLGTFRGDKVEAGSTKRKSLLESYQTAWHFFHFKKDLLTVTFFKMLEICSRLKYKLKPSEKWIDKSVEGFNLLSRFLKKLMIDDILKESLFLNTESSFYKNRKNVSRLSTDFPFHFDTWHEPSEP